MAATEGDGRAAPPPAATFQTNVQENIIKEVIKEVQLAPEEGAAGRRRNFPGTCEQDFTGPKNSTQIMDASLNAGK